MIKKIKFLDEIIIKEREYKDIVENNGYNYFLDDSRDINNSPKHIVFLGYSKTKMNKFYCLSTTSKKKENVNQVKVLINNNNIFLNLGTIYLADSSKLLNPKIRTTKYYNNIKEIVKSKLSNRKLKFLNNNTNMFIWKRELKKRKNNLSS